MRAGGRIWCAWASSGRLAMVPTMQRALASADISKPDAVCVTIGPGLAGALLFYAVPLAYSMFTALMGLAVNLAYPNLSWTNEITVIKQSAAVMIAMVIGLAAVAAPIAAVAALKMEHAAWIEAAAVAALAGVSAVLYRRIMTRGVETFEAFE